MTVVAPAPFQDFESRRLPAWLLSLLLHLVVAIAMGLLIRFAPQGEPVVPGRAVGIVLVSGTEAAPSYYSQDSGGGANSGGSATAESPLASPLPGAAEAPIDLAGALPSAAEFAIEGDSLPTPTRVGTGGKPGRKVGDYDVETGIFGIVSRGAKFVYVFDRSGSMEGFQGRPLAAAKSELIRSFQALEKTHQFQIIFYNEQPKIFNPTGSQPPRLLFGDDSTKRHAESFVRGIVADGGTRHLDALLLALRMSPDVIFFLTDANDPKMSADELERIRRANRGAAVINAIEFGAGGFQGGDNFLIRLARENQGRHTYVDVTRLPKVP